MRVTILAIGSRGDVQPYVALALGLQKAGDRVRMAAHESFRSFVESHGLLFSPVPGNPEKYMSSDLVEAGRSPFRFWSRMYRQVKLLSAEVVEACYKASLEADLILYSPLAFMGADLGDLLNKPAFPAHFAPHHPTSAFPHYFFPSLPSWVPLRGAYNRLTHRAYEEIFWQFLRREIAGLKKVPFFSPYRAFLAKKRPMVYAYSPSVIPKPADWEAWIHVTGYWFLEPEWTAPPDLVSFLESGPPPVCVGFGSVVDRDPEEFTRLLLKGVELSGTRAIFLSGWGGIRAISLPPQIFLADAVPHHRLFPQCAAVIHHGGAGTTAASLRAGVPTLVVPHMADQFFWGERVADLGVGPPSIPRSRLTAETLASAIRQALNDAGMREEARALGARIRAEDGVGTAVALLHRLLE